jgi:hypothetical protein
MAQQHLFDNLPTDVIYYGIFPYLDYNSRVTANLLLPSKDRISTPLNKNLALQVLIRININAIKGALKSLRKSHSGSCNRSYSRYLLNVWRIVIKNLDVTQYNKFFRDVILSKINEFTNLSNTDRVFVSAYTLKTLEKLCNTTSELMKEKYPYLREVSLNYSSI